MELTIEIKDNKTLKLLEDLEALKLIRVLKSKTSNKKRKLSERLAGSITPKKAKELDRELKKTRSEWSRSI